MGDLESRIENIENYLFNKFKFKTPRLVAKAISEGKIKPEHLDEKSDKVIEQLANSILNSISEDTIKTMTKDEKKETVKKIKEMGEQVLDSKLDEDHITNILNRLKQLLNKIEDSEN